VLGAVLLILLILALVGGLPAWGWHSYGYAPSGGVVLLIILLLVFARPW
jgi:hypothetical protein